MPAPGALSVGKAVTSATTGSVVNLVPRGGQLLGFFASATTTLTMYDSASTTTTSVIGVALTACAVGWNAYPIEFQNGLAVNQGAQLSFVIV